MPNIRSSLFITSLLFALNAYSTTQLVTENLITPSTSLQTAQAGQHPTKPALALPLPPKLDLNAKGWILIDYKTGAVLSQNNATSPWPPASLAKLLAAYVIFQSIQQGHIHLTDEVTVSEKASKTPGSKMFLKPHEKVTVANLLKGMIIQSGNDATVALAEHVAGSEKAFVHMMNHTAQQLGMKGSHFGTPNGLPAQDQYTCAQDMATLARALIHHFPKEYTLFSQKSFTWNGITQRSRNPLLQRDPSVDGLKTGYTQAAKYALVASSHKEGMRLISVVIGAPTKTLRADDSERLLKYGFRFYENHTFYQPHQPLETIEVKGGKAKNVEIGPAHQVIATLPKGHLNQVKAQLTLPKSLQAPVKANQVVGQLKLYRDQTLLGSYPVVALKAVEKGNLYHRIKNWI